MVGVIAFIGAFTVSLVTTYLISPWLIAKLKLIGMTGVDWNKADRREIPEMGGIGVVVGFFAGVSALMALDGIGNASLLSVSLSAILGAAFVGMMDDLFDLRQGHKALLPFVLALPLGTFLGDEVVIPHVATIDFGPWMTLVAALAITCAANAANMLEGFNGLGTGLGIIMGSTLVILCVIHGKMDGAFILLPLLGGLVAFFSFNKYPAKVFPGDTMMLFMGATLAAAGMLSELHVQTTFIFIPMILEFFLKLRGRFRAENYATMTANGHLAYAGRIESITHLMMRHWKCTEKSLVYGIYAIEAVFCAVVIVVDYLL